MKKLLNKMELLNLNPKKEITLLIVCDFVFLASAVVAVILLKNVLLLGIGVGIAGIFSTLYLSRYGGKIEKINKENVDEFAVLFNYFRIYIHNGYSVYSALKEIMVFANENLKKMLAKLIEEIDNDKTVQPFINFSKNFNEIIVEEMMISIYQMVDDGEQSDYLLQFEMIFDKFSELISQKNLKNKDSKLGTLSSAPLIGSCFLIIVLTVGIVNVIGVLINGI